LLDIIINILIWAIVGAVPGFYVTYIKRHDPRLGVIGGAIFAVVFGYGGVSLGIFNNAGVAMFTILALWVIGLFLIPYGNYDEKVTARGRIALLAYALTLPTVLIVLSIVIFPLIWNLVFSVRDISVGDLQNVELFDLSGASFDNFENQVSFRLDTVPCAEAEGGGCELDEDGDTVYQDARRYIGDAYRGFREVNNLTIFGEHYAIGVQNTEFYPMIWRTIFYTFASTIMAILVGLIAALLVRDQFPGRAVFRGFILFPYIAPVISVAFIWQVLFATSGLVNETLGTNTAFLSTRDSFLGISVPLIMVILFQTWRYFPFAFLFLLARIQAIPDDMYEAAKVDGASPSQRLLFITLPQLRAVFGTLFLLRFIWTFNKFDDVFLLTGPITQTKVIPVQIFEALFTETNVGEASAIAVIMACMLAIILLIYFRYFLVEEV